VILENDGWCTVHGIGYIGGVEVQSETLYSAMDAHGHTVDLSTFVCPGCRKAIAEQGFCEEHNIGFVRGQAYFSFLTYQLARGEKRRIADITCPVCRENAAGRGWCEKHQIGMVGRVAIRGRRDYDRVARMLERLELANGEARRCETCAVALALDGYCPFCKRTYQDGKWLESPPAAATPPTPIPAPPAN